MNEDSSCAIHEQRRPQNKFEYMKANERNGWMKTTAMEKKKKKKVREWKIFH